MQWNDTKRTNWIYCGMSYVMFFANISHPYARNLIFHLYLSIVLIDLDSNTFRSPFFSFESSSLLFSSHNLILANKEPIVVKLFHNFLGVMWRIQLFVHVFLSPFFHTLTQCHRCRLQPIVWNFRKEQVMYHMTIHHVMTHSVHPRTIIAIHRFECPTLEGKRIVGIQFPIVGMMLQIGYHEEPKAHDHPWAHTDDGKVGSAHRVPQQTSSGTGYHNR